MKLDVEKQYKDEKWTLLDEAKSKAEQQLKDNDEMWNKKLAECKKEVNIVSVNLLFLLPLCRTWNFERNFRGKVHRIVV